MTVALTLQFRPQTCCHQGCGIVFALTVDHDDTLRRTRESFFCPKGHSQSYMGESHADKIARLERERDAWRERKYQADREGEARTFAVERRRRATAGHLTRIKRRVAAGVCPCCNRSFSNLARHVAGQHPEFVAAAKGSDSE